MRKSRRILAWLSLAALLCAARALPGRLPASNEGIAARTASEWSGVLRLWVCVPWRCGTGSLNGWLNGCLARFERAHGGVRVQAQPVTEALLRAFAEAENPPDALLFAPGALDAPDNLLAREGRSGARAELGHINEEIHATPVAMGGYAWVYNRAMLDGIPQKWPSADPPSRGRGRKTALFWLDCAADQPFVSWSGALLSLMEKGDTGAEAAEKRLGVDLGLPTAVPTTAPTPGASAGTETRALPERLPATFRATDDCLGAFLKGEIAAMPATQREIQRLSVYAEQGRAPDYAIGEGAVFTDQLALFATVNCPRDDLTARQALCEKLLNHLLSDESQTALKSARAFRVDGGAPLYTTNAEMRALESALASNEMSVPPAFGSAWREALRREADALPRSGG